MAARARALVVIVGLLLSTTAAAAQRQEPFTPEVGQKGKDVVWVPTPEPLVEKMLDLAKVGRGDFVIDLGSGDGRNVIGAARRGARALGVEYNPDMVELSRRKAADAGVAGRAKFERGDMFQADISRATVMALFLLPSNLLQLRPKFLALAPGSRIVSNTFLIADWPPDASVSTDEACEMWCEAHLWIVPAQVAGRWRLRRGELALTQTFQKLTGTLTMDGKETPVTGTLRGADIELSSGAVSWKGRVRNGALELQAGDGRRIKATRVSG
ncbi:MAG TPA: methyltransferase domain-containing protein [Vicinamibacterales bacterium]|nr:methyltransferase domain-containing protein [Vicinamibacterales bacterium]